MRKLPWLKKPQPKLKTESREQVLKVRNSRQWRDKTRPQKLLFEPRCEYCLEKGKLTEATEVDHIIPLEAGGSPFDPDNLKSTCRVCHGRKTGDENKERHKLKVSNN
jgi:5-methylcytosine-specific restriction protein A